MRTNFIISRPIASRQSQTWARYALRVTASHKPRAIHLTLWPGYPPTVELPRQGGLRESLSLVVQAPWEVAGRGLVLNVSQEYPMEDESR